MPAQKQDPDFDQTHEQLKTLSGWIFLLILPMLFASVLSLPFPFVRQIWMKEVFGLTGLLNALLLGWISVQTKKMHLPPIVSGAGLFLNEQILTSYGFFALMAAGEAGKKDILFFVVSSIAGLIFLVLLLRASGTVIRYKKWFYTDGPGSELQLQEEPEGILALILSMVVYVLLFAGIYLSKFLPGPWSIAVLKVITQIGSFLAFLGAGYEIHFYLRRDQGALQCWVKGLSHCMALVIILWLAYQRMPLASLLRTS